MLIPLQNSVQQSFIDQPLNFSQSVLFKNLKIQG